MKKRLFPTFIFSVVLSIIFPFIPVKAATDEYAWFPAYTMAVNQLAYESASHGEQNAIDILPYGNVFAPFTGEIVYTDPNWGYVVLQSEDKVHWADGTYDYMSVGFMHDEDITDLYVGKKIKQGEDFYQAGSMGNSTGDHVHITVHRGHVQRGYPYGNGDAFAYDAFFVNPEYTTQYAGRGEGKVFGNNGVYNNAPTDYTGIWQPYNSYLSKCTYYPTYQTVEITASTTYKTLPCSKKTDANSLDIRNGVIGEQITAIGLYQNTAGNYWYKVIVDGQTGYLYSQNAVCIDASYDDLDITEISAPVNLKYGDRFSIKGIISTQYNEIHSVTGQIRRSSDGQILYEKTVPVNKKSYSLLNSEIDMAMLFNELMPGEYTYTVSVDITDYYSEDGKSLSSGGICATLIDSSFWVE